MPQISPPEESIVKAIAMAGNSDIDTAVAGQMEIAKAIETPLRKAVLDGDVLGNIFQSWTVPPGTSTEYPTDLISPGMEGVHIAYTIPGHGRIPERTVQSDYITIATYSIGSSIDFLLRYAREANWDVVGRAMQAFNASFVRKLNRDGWQTLLAAAVGRNVMVYDGDATAGMFTKRLVSLMQTVMRRNAGGNTGSGNRGRLTDLYVSPEALEDVRNWGLDQISDAVRTEIYKSPSDGPSITNIFGVNLIDLDELGVGQEFQEFFLNELSGNLEAADQELVVGIDKGSNDSFIMPVKQSLEVFPDPMLHRQQRAGFYGWMETGFGVLDARRIIAGSF
jgi:hypothetical protein